MLNFLSKYVYKMQLYLKPFYNILRQQNNFEWNSEHQTRFEEIEKLLTEQNSNTIPDPNQPFYAICDDSNFGSNGSTKMNLISANSRFFYTSRTTTLYPHERMYSYKIYTYRIRISDTWIKTFNSFIYRSQTNYIYFTQKSNPNHRVYRFQLILMKFLIYI